MDPKELDEYMEALWYITEKEEPCVDNLKKYERRAFTDEVISRLEQAGYIKIAESGALALTSDGYEKSRQIIRCHRLAERLLADVLGMKPKETEEGACDFEHVIVPEIADSICTLLGHPRECPHGLKIPEGKCCRGARETVSSAIVSLDRVRIGDVVKVSYVSTPSNSRMHKLSHFGIIPGASIRVHQRYPSFVVECGNTQLAMEEEMAREIFVMYPADGFDSTPPVRRHKWRRFRGRGRL